MGVRDLLSATLAKKKRMLQDEGVDITEQFTLKDKDSVYVFK